MDLATLLEPKDWLLHGFLEGWGPALLLSGDSSINLSREKVGARKNAGTAFLACR